MCVARQYTKNKLVIIPPVAKSNAENSHTAEEHETNKQTKAR